MWRGTRSSGEIEEFASENRPRSGKTSQCLRTISSYRPSLRTSSPAGLVSGRDDVARAKVLNHARTLPTQGGSGSAASTYSTTVVRTIRL